MVRQAAAGLSVALGPSERDTERVPAGCGCRVTVNQSRSCDARQVQAPGCPATASLGWPTSLDSTYFIPGIEAAQNKDHIVLHQEKVTNRGEWRVGDYGIDAIRFLARRQRLQA